MQTQPSFRLAHVRCSVHVHHAATFTGVLPTSMHTGCSAGTHRTCKQTRWSRNHWQVVNSGRSSHELDERCTFDQYGSLKCTLGWRYTIALRTHTSLHGSYSRTGHLRCNTRLVPLRCTCTFCIHRTHTLCRRGSRLWALFCCRSSWQMEYRDRGMFCRQGNRYGNLEPNRKVLHIHICSRSTRLSCTRSLCSSALL